jgi:hypothetical protein
VATSRCFSQRSWHGILQKPKVKRQPQEQKRLPLAEWEIGIRQPAPALLFIAAHSDRYCQISNVGKVFVNQFGRTWIRPKVTRPVMPQNPFSSFLEDNELMKPVAEARNAIIKSAVDYWQSLCGQRQFPARSNLTLRGIAAFLRFSVIVSVIDNGADYEFRYVGEAHRQAFKTYFRGIRVSQVEAAAPGFGGMLRATYERVRLTGVPFIISGPIDLESPDSNLPYHETAFFPLGVDDSAVDHVLIVGVQVPKPFWHLSDEQLKKFDAPDLTAA